MVLCNRICLQATSETGGMRGTKMAIKGQDYGVILRASYILKKQDKNSANFVQEKNMWVWSTGDELQLSLAPGNNLLSLGLVKWTLCRTLNWIKLRWANEDVESTLTSVSSHHSSVKSSWSSCSQLPLTTTRGHTWGWYELRWGSDDPLGAQRRM